MTGNVYAILGGRGDVGSTATAVALGASLAETAHRVAVIDANFDDEGVGAALDLGDPDRTLRDVLRGDADLDDALVEAPHGLQVLPSGDAAPAPTDVRSYALVRAADRVRERFDVVLLDLGAAGGTPAGVTLERADGAILVSTPEDDAIAAVADAATVARYHGADVFGTAFTKIPDGTEIDHESAAEAIDTDVIAMVPEDEAVAESAAAGASLLRHDPDSPAAMVYWELASRLADGDLRDEPVVHEPPTGEAAADEATVSEPQRQGSADDADETIEEESPSPDPKAGEQRSSTAVDATSQEPDRADADSADDAEPVAPPAPDDSGERSSASAADREDAGEHRSPGPASTSSREDAAEQSSASPRSQAHEDADERRSSKSDSQESDASDNAADGSASERGSPAPDDGTGTATDSEPDGDPSRNEFSWDEDPIDGDEPDGGDESPLDDESRLGEERDEPGTGAGDGADPEPTIGSEAEESGDGGEGDGEGDGEDDIDAAFKATMDKVREQNGDADDEDDEDDEEESGGMFGIGG